MLFSGRLLSGVATTNKLTNDQRAKLALLARSRMGQGQPKGINSILPLMMMGGNDNAMNFMLYSSLMRGGLGQGMGMRGALPFMMMNEMGFF